MKVYRSRIGWEIWIPVWIILLYQLYITLTTQRWVGFLMIALLIGFFVLTIIKTRYIIKNDNILNVKCWFMIDVKIEITSIHRIRKTWSPLSSPAASLIGRIKVYYDNGKSIIVSPYEKQAFINDLLTRNKKILTFEAW